MLKYELNRKKPKFERCGLTTTVGYNCAEEQVECDTWFSHFAFS